MYKCSECGLGVIIIGEEIIRACTHEDAPIIADMQAVANGKSKIE